MHSHILDPHMRPTKKNKDAAKSRLDCGVEMATERVGDCLQYVLT